MHHFSFELSLLAMIPGLALCGYVFYKDRVEKEPIGLLALLFGIGAVAYVPSYFLQQLVTGLIDRLFAGQISFSPEGIRTFATTGAELLHGALCAFFGFSLIQVCLKWVALYFGSHKNKNFNYLFDGVVYSVFLSLGFAVGENIHFALVNNGDMIVAKLLTSVPAHLFVGILMGYYYTMWRMRFLANSIENRMLADGVIEKDNIRTSAGWLISSLVIPVLVNSLYAFTASVKNETVTAIFYGAVFAVYGISYVVINQIAAREMRSARFLCRIVAKGHPELPRETIEQYVGEGDR